MRIETNMLSTLIDRISAGVFVFFGYEKFEALLQVT